MFRFFPDLRLRVMLLLALLALLVPRGAHCEPASNPLVEVPLAQLSDHALSPLGMAALEVRRAEWKHAESGNFIFHFFQGFIAASVAIEAEFDYGVISRELEKDTTQWERKAHIFIFEQPADWSAFQSRAALDPWSGGIHSGNELFIQRNPALKFKGDSLAHEITHLVVHRFFGSGVPLWLNEGYAQYAASRAYAAFHRARGYSARPHSSSVAPGNYLALSELTGAVGYPRETAQVEAFYAESERLVRFLSMKDKRGFGVFFEALAKGRLFDSALGKAFGGRFSTLDALEGQFRTYASQDYGPPSSD